MKKNVYRITTIITYIIISALALSISTNYIFEEEKRLLHKKYNNTTLNMHDKINALILKKKNATLALTLTLSNSLEVSNILDNKISENNLGKLSLLLREETDFKNVWFQVLSKEGISLYRSWSDKKNDELYKVRSDLRQMIKDPKIKSTISVGRYDMTFKAMVPIYKKGKFVGVLESITHFNSISRGLRKSDNIEPIIIVDQKYTEQLRKNAFTKIFLQNHYIANLSVDKDILSYLNTKSINEILTINNYLLTDDYLIINTPIIFENNKLANFLTFKRTSDIDILYIEEYKQNAYLYLGLFIILLGLVLYIISYYLYSQELRRLYVQLNENQKELHTLNTTLQKTVEEEVSKNYEKNKILFQQSKMAAMGEMIGNIAHQWRQPLSIITTAASGMKMKKEMNILKEEEYIEYLDRIVNTSSYLSTTIDDFRNFFSPNKNKTKFNSVNLFNRVLNLINTEFRNKDIEIISNIDDIEIYTYENELLQVLINLFNNARDELIKIKGFDDKYIFVDLYKDNDCIVIKIKDSAGGISSDIIDRIFEPYFTTKHKSQGTGIGLFMSEEIIAKHMKGKIIASNETFTYENKEYIGALFTLLIPITDELV